MKKFKFQLAALLKVTQMKKEQAEIAFAEATQALQAERDALRAMEEEIKAGRERYYRVAAGSVTVSDLMSYSAYFTRMEAETAEQQGRIETARTNRAAALEALKAAMQKLKSIEQLKERRLAQFKAMELAEEQKALDEIGLQIYTRMAR